jgi:hypothetical protein
LVVGSTYYIFAITEPNVEGAPCTQS